MSRIPTRQIDGDVAVGRDVAAGGDVSVRGSVLVGHDLRVEGWLDALHVKTACKGIFSSQAKLEHAYPAPQPGWYAGVCVGEKTELWLAVRELDECRGAVWKRSSGAFVAVVDDTRYKEMVAEVERLRDEATAASGAATAAQSAAEAAQRTAQGAQAAAASAQVAASAAASAASAATPRTIEIGELDTMGVADVQAMKQLVSSRSGVMHTRYAVMNGVGGASYVAGTLDVFSDNSRHVLTQVLETHHTLAADGSLNAQEHRDEMIFRYWRSFNFSAANLDVEANAWTAWRELVPEGVVRLGADGKLAEDIMPELRAVLGFGGTVGGVTVASQSTTHVSTDDGCQVVYDREKRLLLLRVGGGGVSLSGGDIDRYYGNWGDAEAYGEAIGVGVVPRSGVLYVDYVENLLYRWDGAEFVALGSRMALGEGETDAYPGNLGAQNAEGLAEVREVVKEIYGTVMSCELPIDTLTAPGYYRLTNGVVLTVSKSANEVVNPTTARWTVTQTMFAHDGIVTRSAEVVKSGRDVTTGAWSEWENRDERIDKKMQRMREDIDSLKEIVGTLSGGGSGPVKVIRFDEDTGTLYI